MRLAGSAILTAIFVLAATITSFYMLYRLAKEKGGAHALLGFLFPPYVYVWGWINARRLELLDVMAFWTFVSVAAVMFPLLMGTFSAASLPLSAPSSGASFSADEIVRRGPISPGSAVQGRIDDLFGIDEWTFNGAAGQQVTIRCAPVAGSDTDPRLNLLDPTGVVIAGDDDGGGGKTALLNAITLPSAGTYTIQVDVWFTGPYVLTLE